MELSECKFYISEPDMSFSVFSDGTCRARYLESIFLQLVRGRVDVYQIAPGVNAQWIAVRQKTDGRQDYRWFVRRSDKFYENSIERFPQELKRKIAQRYPEISREESLLVA